MNSPIKICPMTQDHIRQVAEIEQECFSEGWTFEQFRDALDCDFIECVTAALDDEVVGYTVFYKVAGEGQITNVAVRKSMRRQGIAERLLKYIFDYAIKHGISRYMLEVRASNVAAIALYKSLGFTVDGIRREFYRHPTEDAILMSKKAEEL